MVRRPPVADGHWSIDLPATLKQIYQSRGVTSCADVDLSLSGLIPPGNLRHGQQAANLIADAIVAQRKILLVGDYDCDGATSTAVAIRLLRSMGALQVNYLVPNRFEFGYGLSPQIVELALSDKPDLIITVDNGISSIEGVASANSHGISVIVTDHHLPGDSLPEADAIVNPNQNGCDFPSKAAAGVGVIFYVMSLLRAELRARQWFAAQGLPEPNLAEVLDIVALGTVADVVPLDRNNRILVEQGLKRIRAGKAHPGVLALIAVAGRDYQRVVATDLGFAVGPRLNAAGRLDDISVGIECLLSDSAERAQTLAEMLNAYNEDRKAIEVSMQKEAFAEVEQRLSTGEDLPWGLCLYDDSWHQGVTGLLAARVREKVHRPVVVFAPADDGVMWKGSGRSIPGFHLRDALDRVATLNPGLIDKFGGHAAAAGLSVAEDKLSEFCTQFDRVTREWLSEDDLSAVILSDGELPPEALTLDFAEQLRAAGPWGQAFPEPVFDGVFAVVQAKVVGQRHCKLVLDSGQGALVDAIQFNSPWAGQTLPDRVRVAFKLDVNRYRNQSNLQFIVDYLEASELPGR
ncbi:MAG: single-stranded-DNA-specific exonuclease RecJ [Pseudomonadales bacterium]|nr:single-stranded-DNA-specific exonuclease RecJ [Pseudomonadales bacterium]